MNQPRRFTQLLENKTLARIERMRILSTRKFTNRGQGEHMAGKGGASTEFADYRDYVAGDDVRNVDWNIFARLQRPYIKLFRFEEAMHVVILVDASSSMQVEEKFQRARQLAASFGIMGLLNVERVSIYSFNHLGTVPKFISPCSGRASMKRVLTFLEELDVGGDFPIDAAVESLLNRHRGRGVVILLSDFLTLGDLVRPMNMLFSAGLEVFALQLLSPAEIQPDLAGDWRFVDMENEQTLDISSVNDLLVIYYEQLLRLQNWIGALCRQRSGKYLCVNSQTSVETILFDVLRRKGWVQ